ncbi:MAG: polysaccharide biosynthesis tyrosine autokinase [Clostridiales bacterium]|nr:polysaccharide biosynthesis tyrosine autokinase [Clostridiales bacterium]
MSEYSRTQKTEEEVEPIDLLHLLDGLWKAFCHYFWLVLLLTALGAGGLALRSYLTYTPQYLAYATFTVTSSSQSSYSTSNYYNTATASQLESTFPYLLTSGSLARIVAEDLGVSTLNGTITASVMANTNLFTIEVRSSSPQTAYDIVQSLIENYPEVAEQVVGVTELELLDESGVPTQPTNTVNYVNTAIKGGLLGFALGVAILFLITISRQTIQRESDFKKRLNIECLASIPQISVKRRAKGNAQAMVSIYNPHISQSFLDAVRVLRTRVERDARDHGSKVLLVTSAAPGEGKSTLAANIAMSLAMDGRKVLLMDCDLRNPTVHEMLQLQPGKGVYELLTGEAKLDEVFQYDKAHRLYVLPGGKPCSNASEILDSQQMRELLSSVKPLVDYVILDTAPVGMITDTAVLAPLADGAIFVVKQDYARTGDILEAVEQLSESRIHMIGCVLNGVTSSPGGYGYGYGYGYSYGSYRHYGGYGERPAETEQTES